MNTSPGFLHAKSFVCDDEIAVVGTINLDYRSLYLHFENGVWFYKNKVIQDILSDFQETLNYCDPISIDFCRNRNIVIRAFQSILRLLHLYSDIHLDEAFLQKQYPPRILTAERYCFYVS